MKYYVDPMQYGGAEKAEILARAAERRFPGVRFAIGPGHCTRVEGQQGLASQVATFLAEAAASPEPVTTTVTGDASLLTEAAAEEAAALPRPPIRFPVARTPEPELPADPDDGADPPAELVEGVSELLQDDGPPNDEDASGNPLS